MFCHIWIVAFELNKQVNADIFLIDADTGLDPDFLESPDKAQEHQAEETKDSARSRLSSRRMSELQEYR